MLPLEFGDFCPNVDPGTERIWVDAYGDGEWCTIFHEGHAEQIAAFVADLRPDEGLTIHCDAGISRSVGVAVVLGQVLNREVKLGSALSTSKANAHVMRVLRRRIGAMRLRR